MGLAKWRKGASALRKFRDAGGLGRGKGSRISPYATLSELAISKQDGEVKFTKRKDDWRGGSCWDSRALLDFQASADCIEPAFIRSPMTGGFCYVLISPWSENTSFYADMQIA